MLTDLSKEAPSEVAFNVQSFGLLFATIANTNATIVNCLTQIIKHKEVYNTVNKEIDEATQGKSLAEGLKHVPLLNACITETLRLFAPPIHFRKAKTEIQLPSGRKVPANTILCISPYLRHRNPNVYPDPEQFRPQRYLESAISGKFNFLTFGQGRHYCLGKQLAENEILIAVMVLLKKYDLSFTKYNDAINYFTTGVMIPKDTVIVHYEKK